MLILRLLILLSALGIAGCVLAWLLTGERRYRRWAWLTFRFSLFMLFGVLALFALERVLLPL